MVLEQAPFRDGLNILISISFVVGLVVNQAALAAVYKTFNTIFNEQLNITVPLWKRVAMEVPSTGASVDYKWLGSFPMLREWIGERVIKNLSAFEYNVKNKNFEATIELDRNDVEDDNVGVYRPSIQALGENAVLHPDTLIFSDLLKNGFTKVGYDGQFFFDTDHPVGGVSVANTDGGAGTPWFLLDVGKVIKPLVFQSRRKPEFIAKDNPNDENVFMRRKFLYGVDYRGNAGYALWQLAWGSKQTLNAANYAIARAAMGSFKNDDGVPLNIMPKLLVVPPTLEGAGNALVKAQKDASGADNIWFGTAELMVVPWLA